MKVLWQYKRHKRHDYQYVLRSILKYTFWYSWSFILCHLFKCTISYFGWVEWLIDLLSCYCHLSGTYIGINLLPVGISLSFKVNLVDDKEVPTLYFCYQLTTWQNYIIEWSKPMQKWWALLRSPFIYLYIFFKGIILFYF